MGEYTFRQSFSITYAFRRFHLRMLFAAVCLCIGCAIIITQIAHPKEFFMTIVMGTFFTGIGAALIYTLGFQKIITIDNGPLVRIPAGKIDDTLDDEGVRKENTGRYLPQEYIMIFKRDNIKSVRLITTKEQPAMQSIADDIAWYYVRSDKNVICIEFKHPIRYEDIFRSTAKNMALLKISRVYLSVNEPTRVIALLSR